MTRIALLLGLFLTTATTFAQIYPKQTDVESQKLKGRVESVIDISRSFSATEDRWEPLTATSIMRFNEQGNLLKRGIYLHREKSDKQLYVYKADADSVMPVFDATALMFASGESQPLEEHLYAYDEEGRLAGVIDRDYKTGQTTKRQYSYAKSMLTGIISRDSATGLITEIEQFYYQQDGKPSGSSIRQFNIKTDQVKVLDDTVKIPASRVMREYTSYEYGNSATPVIYWHGVFGADTVVDRQDNKRYLADGTLSSTMAHTYSNGKATSQQSYLFNDYGDVLSSSVSFWDAAAKNDSGTTYQRGFDYHYDAPDDKGNWMIRVQYSQVGDTIAMAGKRILLSRTDRQITYFK